MNTGLREYWQDGVGSDEVWLAKRLGNNKEFFTGARLALLLPEPNSCARDAPNRERSRAVMLFSTVEGFQLILKTERGTHPRYLTNFVFLAEVVHCSNHLWFEHSSEYFYTDSPTASVFILQVSCELGVAREVKASSLSGWTEQHMGLSSLGPGLNLRRCTGNSES